MKPRRPIFAKDYITETVDFLHKVVTENPETEADELNWFCDVLMTYFLAVKNDPVIDEAKRLFDVTIKTKNLKITDKIPYVRDFSNDIPSFEQFENLSLRRRSVRWFEDRAVPRELIDQAILASSQSPSACNRQPFRFHIFDDPSLVQEVSNIPGGTAGFSHNFPVFIAVIGQLRAYFDERDRHVIYIDASLASMSFLFALETLGLSSCAINWPDVPEREKQMSKALDLDGDERVIMCIAVGYPDKNEKVPFSHKKSLSQLRKYN
ncbi:MAG: nitroreductase family protein [Aliiglaciecola sp.]|uniref:nitroreductase family protein n=1 Tax=Aliiglaciecola sp. TaxID=1872441 RepID=UPI003297F13E